MLGNNTAGLKRKRESFESVIKQLDAGVAMLQETKYIEKGQLSLRICAYLKKYVVKMKGEG